jgi:hypothetical protein
VPADEQPDAGDEADDADCRPRVDGRRLDRVGRLALRHHDPAGEVEEQADAAGEREHEERDADDRRVDAEVVADAGRDARDLPVGRPDEAPRLGAAGGGGDVCGGVLVHASMVAQARSGRYRA